MNSSVIPLCMLRYPCTYRIFWQHHHFKPFPPRPPPAAGEINFICCSSSMGTILMYCRLVLVLVLSSIASSQSIIKTLPGFPGNLPFKLETGYVGVDDMDDVQLFYYFVKSERNPRDDLYCFGSPEVLVVQHFLVLYMKLVCPLSFDYAKSNENLPTFKLNPYSWTKLASMIFLDAPVGTGFSYSRTAEGYNMNDTTISFTNLYFSKEGIIIPMVVQEISNGNDEGKEPKMNIQGYTIGNPVTDHFSDFNSRIEYTHRVGILSDELYEELKESCNGKYVYVDPSNVECTNNLKVYTQCINKIYSAHILKPSCAMLSPNPNASKLDRSSLQEINSIGLLLSQPQKPEPWCRGTVKDWVRCNESLSYTSNVFSSVDYHRNLTKKAYRALIYSGDHDMLIPYVGTQAWIASLNLNISEDWQPWFVDGQVAGLGAGHTAPEYRPKEGFAMVYRWLAHYFL
ncbi:Serine carboxypeptidase-like 18 [Vitis vinifera]|uniref:Serine carboxypeptidase-like 18 n=1 Tax=Vitis vinifera TaxID=29760 RepID=A0A438HDF7_VITVI|nr:Serine carboxypeptidase-like 18 [Vitis vinifera]